MTSFLLSVSFHFVQLLSLEEAWTLVLDDALANSFIAPATDDLKDDNQLTCKFFLQQSQDFKLCINPVGIFKYEIEIVNICFVLGPWPPCTQGTLAVEACYWQDNLLYLLSSGIQKIIFMFQAVGFIVLCSLFV